MENKAIRIEAIVNAGMDKVWNSWTAPEHITQWCNASDDWHAPWATNDVQAGGKFTTRMEAKDGSFGFEFGGTYDEVKNNELLVYTLEDGRKVHITFSQNGDQTHVVETFDPETENPAEMQQQGWQTILDNFKSYTEKL